MLSSSLSTRERVKETSRKRSFERLDRFLIETEIKFHWLVHQIFLLKGNRGKNGQKLVQIELGVELGFEECIKA